MRALAGTGSRSVCLFRGFRGFGQYSLFVSYNWCQLFTNGNTPVNGSLILQFHPSKKISNSILLELEIFKYEICWFCLTDWKRNPGNSSYSNKGKLEQKQAKAQTGSSIWWENLNVGVGDDTLLPLPQLSEILTDIWP